MKNQFVILLTFLFATLFSVRSEAQQSIIVDSLCNVKWYPNKYEESDGNVIEIPKSNQKEYIIYNSDGTFQSIEGSIIIKGNWVYDDFSKTITATQKASKNYPQKIISTVLKLTEQELVVQSEDAGGELLKLYFKKSISK